MEDEKEDVSSHSMTLRKKEGTAILKRKYEIAFYGELVLRDAMDLPAIDKRVNECFIDPHNLYPLLSNCELVTKANYVGRFICIYSTYEISGMSMGPIRTGFPGLSRFYGF